MASLRNERDTPAHTHTHTYRERQREGEEMKGRKKEGKKRKETGVEASTYRLRLQLHPALPLVGLARRQRLESFLKEVTGEIHPGTGWLARLALWIATCPARGGRAWLGELGTVGAKGCRPACESGRSPLGIVLRGRRAAVCGRVRRRRRFWRSHGARGCLLVGCCGGVDCACSCGGGDGGGGGGGGLMVALPERRRLLATARHAGRAEGVCWGWGLKRPRCEHE